MPLAPVLATALSRQWRMETSQQSKRFWLRGRQIQSHDFRPSGNRRPAPRGTVARALFHRHSRMARGISLISDMRLPTLCFPQKPLRGALFIESPPTCKQATPTGFERLGTILIAVWTLGFCAGGAAEPKIFAISPPEKGFFTKRLDYYGIPIKAPEVVVDEALHAAYDRFSMLLS